MNQKALETLEYRKIIAQLKREMGSAASAKLADELTPLTSEKNNQRGIKVDHGSG